MRRNTKIALAAGGGLVGGGLLTWLLSSKPSTPVLPPVSQTPPPEGAPVFVSSTGSLNNGWLYYLTLGPAGLDPVAAAAAAQSAGFVDPTSKNAPSFVQQADGTDKALTLYTGQQGASVPTSTNALQWISVLGLPAPTILNVSSRGIEVLTNGWVYQFTLFTPVTNMTMAANIATMQAYLASLGFVDPTTRGPVPLQPLRGSSPPGSFTQAFALFTGQSGTAVPTDTPNVHWQDIVGSPNAAGTTA